MYRVRILIVLQNSLGGEKKIIYLHLFPFIKVIDFRKSDWKQWINRTQFNYHEMSDNEGFLLTNLKKKNHSKFFLVHNKKFF